MTPREKTIDILMATHRELTAVDLVKAEIQHTAQGPINLIIQSGGEFYLYKIMKSGAIAEARQSENNIKFTELYYFDK